MLNKIMNFLMCVVPFVWLMMSIPNFFAGNYDKATYDLAAGVFFMILPMYFDFLDGKR
jgi:hypothetical protein